MSRICAVAALLLAVDLGGCSLASLAQQDELCQFLHSKEEGFKQVCERGNYFTVKSVLVATPVQYIAYRIQQADMSDVEATASTPVPVTPDDETERAPRFAERQGP